MSLQATDVSAEAARCNRAPPSLLPVILAKITSRPTSSHARSWAQLLVTSALEGPATHDGLRQCLPFPLAASACSSIRWLCFLCKPERLQVGPCPRPLLRQTVCMPCVKMPKSAFTPDQDIPPSLSSRRSRALMNCQVKRVRRQTVMIYLLSQ
jgi:hypothetical protein